MTHSQLRKRAATAGVCAAVGALAGIAGSAAAPIHSRESHPARYATDTRGADGLRMRHGAPAFKLGAGGPPVHAVLIVPNKAANGFDTVTRDSGTVKAVSSNSLTITEGTDKATYATPTLTLPADATVERDFHSAKLADVQAGDHVEVSSSSDGATNIFAVDSQHWPPRPPDFMQRGGPPAPPGARLGAGFAHPNDTP